MGLWRTATSTEDALTEPSEWAALEPEQWFEKQVDDSRFTSRVPMRVAELREFTEEEIIEEALDELVDNFEDRLVEYASFSDINCPAEIPPLSASDLHSIRKALRPWSKRVTPTTLVVDSYMSLTPEDWEDYGLEVTPEGRVLRRKDEG